MKRKEFDVPVREAYEREYAPRRWPSPRSDVATPLGQAVITALVVTIAPAWMLSREFDWQILPTFGLLFSVVLALAWLWRLGVITDTLWDVEKVTGLDLNRDGAVGRPRPSVHVEIASGNSQQYVDIEGLETIQALRRFAILGVTNRLNERAVKSQFGWSREQWQETRDELVRRGVLSWNGQEGSTQGVSLTETGEKVMRAILDDLSPAG
jgi:hypothetical protein